MFGEDIVQKALFVFSRGFHRQAMLILAFIIFAVAVGFYDTLLWGLDNPGYILQRQELDGESLASQIADSPAYLGYISANLTHPNEQNDLNTTFNINLFVPSLNFTLPGIFAERPAEVVPPLNPLGPGENATARIWLDDSGFAVGLDASFMWAGDMISLNRSTYGSCLPSNPPGEMVEQTWRCTFPDADGVGLFDNLQGQVSIWWDKDHTEYLMPQRVDNPWKSLGSGAGTAMMKQVFTVTKGRRRHTFLSTVYKATMLAFRPNRLSDTEITNFMERTWSNGTMTASLRVLTDRVLSAKANDTGLTFGGFLQYNTSLASTSTEYINVLADEGDTDPFYSVLRFGSSNITLIRSETLAAAPIPFEGCPGVAYRNLATGGTVRNTNCHSVTPNNDSSTQFLGQIDTSAVTIINDFLGDGTSNLSSVAWSDKGVSWVYDNEDKINSLLISRALLLGGNRADVTVYVEHTVPAISIVQVILCAIPVVLLILVYFLTRRPVMSYFKNSFLAAVLATTHVSTSSSCQELGYVHAMPEISLQGDDRHVTLRMPGGRILASTMAEQQGLVYEPLMLGKDETSNMSAS